MQKHGHNISVFASTPVQTHFSQGCRLDRGHRRNFYHLSLYVQGHKTDFPPLIPATYAVMVAAAFLSAIAIVNLGCSLGIVPANRGIKTKGLYAVVRHPIYSLYMMHDIGWNLNCFSAHNFWVFVLYCLLTYSRAKCEERLLRQDPAYQEYASKTRYMFLPGII